MKPTNKDDKLKPLQPTLRTKKRFIRFEIESPQKFSFKELSESLTDELLLLLGAIHVGKSGFWLMRDLFNFEKQECILKVSVSYKEELVGALNLINKLQGKDVALRIKRVSGTLKGVKK